MECHQTFLKQEKQQNIVKPKDLVKKIKEFGKPSLGALPPPPPGTFTVATWVQSKSNGLDWGDLGS